MSTCTGFVSEGDGDPLVLYLALSDNDAYLLRWVAYTFGLSLALSCIQKVYAGFGEVRQNLPSFWQLVTMLCMASLAMTMLTGWKIKEELVSLLTMWQQRVWPTTIYQPPVVDVVAASGWCPSYLAGWC